MSLDKWLYNFAKRRKVPSLGLTGEADTVGNTAVTVLLRDGANRPVVCSGTSVPTGAGYAKGCLFIKTDVSTGSSGLYDNQGTTSAASFQVITGTTGITADLSTLTSTVTSAVTKDSTATSQVTSKLSSEVTDRGVDESVITSVITSEGTLRSTDDSSITSKVTSTVTADSTSLSTTTSKFTSEGLRFSTVESKLTSHSL